MYDQVALGLDLIVQKNLKQHLDLIATLFKLLRIQIGIRLEGDLTAHGGLLSTAVSSHVSHKR